MFGDIPVDELIHDESRDDEFDDIEEEELVGQVEASAVSKEYLQLRMKTITVKVCTFTIHTVNCQLLRTAKTFTGFSSIQLNPYFLICDQGVNESKSKKPEISST